MSGTWNVTILQSIRTSSFSNLVKNSSYPEQSLHFLRNGTPLYLHAIKTHVTTILVHYPHAYNITHAHVERHRPCGLLLTIHQTLFFPQNTIILNLLLSFLGSSSIIFCTK